MAQQYTQIRKLGEGAFGAAYLVKDTFHGCYMCMKRISCKGFTEDQEDAAVKEVHVMRSLKHIGILPMQCAFFDQEDLCLVTEYAEGGDLEGYVRRHAGGQRGPGLQEQDALYLFTQIVLAVMFLHHKGVLHRDLKPANILLAGDGTTRIADFGVSTLLRDGVHQSVAGTPLYMSPELGDDRPAVTDKADVWPLGCLLYEMCTGETAFEGNIGAVTLQVQEGRHRPFPPTMSSGVQQLILWCLQPDPAHRPRAVQLLRTPALQAHIKKYSAHVAAQYKRAVPGLDFCEPVTPLPRVFPLQSCEPWPHAQCGSYSACGLTGGGCSDFPAGASTMKVPTRLNAPLQGSAAVARGLGSYDIPGQPPSTGPCVLGQHAAEVGRALSSAPSQSQAENQLYGQLQQTTPKRPPPPRKTKPAVVTQGPF